MQDAPLVVVPLAHKAAYLERYAQPDKGWEFRAEFGVPEEYSPIGGITVGHRAKDLPAQDARIEQRRKPLDDVVHRGQWSAHRGLPTRGD